MKKHGRRTRRRRKYVAPTESKAGEAITVAWAVTVTSLLCCNLTILVLHYLVVRDPSAKSLALLKNLLLIAGSLAGAVSLVLLSVVHRVRTVLPPIGLSVFGALLAAAPLLALLVQFLQSSD